MTVRQIPRIISDDDHVVEPRHVWASRVPAKYRDVAPRIECHGLGGLTYVGGTTHEYELTDDGSPCDIWFYEHGMYPHKRTSPRSGSIANDMTLSAISYDEMRPGCYEPKARVDDIALNRVEASLCFPTFPRFCGQTFLELDRV